MTEKRPWDLTSTHSLEAGAEWLRMKAGALAVVVIRVGDSVLACDPGVAPKDIDAVVCEQMRELARGLDAARREKKRASSLTWEGLHE